MQWLVPDVDRTYGRSPKHALGVTAFLTVAVIAARLATRAVRRSASSMTWQHPADAIRNAVVVCDGVIVPTRPSTPVDPTPTMPLSRSELFVPEVDGGRPVHELDFATRDAGGWR